MNMLSVSDAEMLVNAFMTSRLDYCNALLGGCPVVPRIAKSPKRGRNFHICHRLIEAVMMRLILGYCTLNKTLKMIGLHQTGFA